MVLSTLLFSHLLLATTLKLVSLGLGKHSWMVPLKNLKPTLTWQLLSLTWYTIAITLLKLSALTLYARIFRVEKRTRLVLWGVGALALAWGIGITIEPWTNCRPVCQNRAKWYIAAGTINVLFDLSVLLIPMPLIWALNLQLKKKVLLSMVFLLGYCSAFLSLTRLILVAKSPSSVAESTATSDPSWQAVPILYVANLEAPVGIIALCGPSINQILQRGRSFGWRSIFSTKQNLTPHSDSNKTPRVQRHNDSENSNISKGSVSTKNYYKLKGQSVLEESSKEALNTQRSGGARSDVELEVLRQRGQEFV